MFGKIGPVLAIALLVAGVQPLRAQSADPTTVLEGGIQQHVEEVQRKRGEEQRESAYDREMCWRAGYRGPDIDQCVRSSAEYRRSQNFQWQPDYSGWGTPAETKRRPAVECMSIGIGDGDAIIDCH